MQEYALPEEIRGEWIWSRESLDKLESFVFFRKDFMLSETPASAELWITARTLCHVYINGRYVGFGPPPCPDDDTYVMYFDMGFLVETGKNTIAVLAHNTEVTRYASRRHISGFWAQMNIDDKPSVWSDRTWTCWDADCFATGRPRRSDSGAFTEKLDLRYYPYGWQEREFNSVRWKRPDYSLSLGKARGKLVPLPTHEWNVIREEFTGVPARGTWRQGHAATHISFDTLLDERGPGVYAADAYLHSQGTDTFDFELYTDDPYSFFVNGECVKQQGVPSLATTADLVTSRPLCFRQAPMVAPEGELTLKRGWNRLVITQQVEPGSAGITLVMSNLDPGDFRLLRKEAQENMMGWNLAGPIRTPLALVTGNITLSGLPKTPYVSNAKELIDESAYLMSCVFEASETTTEMPERITLTQGEYVILDLGKPVYGCPELTFAGEDEDVVDIVCGEHLYEGQLLPYHDRKRNVDTLILGPKQCQWTGCAPRGLRYIMVVVRRASGSVAIEAPAVCVREYSFDNAGEFECSDKTLNRIWEVGCQTLRGTVQGRFLDSPTKENAQYIADAMIQSWASYHAFGCFEMAAKAIEEFATVQFETGEMPAVAPSDVYLNMPDYALLWPVWLQRHYLYTGDLQFLGRMIPTLDKLFSYYAYIAGPNDDTLVDLDLKYNAYCFLDHGPIERQGVITGLNAIYSRALLSGAWLYDEARSAGKASTLRHRATSVGRRIRELCWDPKRELFADGWHDGEMSQFYSWQTNVLAVYGGIATSEQYNAMFNRLFSPDEPYELFAAGDTNNPYFKYFTLEAAFALERRAWAISLLRWYWGAMVERGAQTWWELFDPESKEDELLLCSMCHGYGTSPNGFLCTELAGIRPAKPGFTVAYFNPLPEAAEWVKAQVPTPYGHILVEWRKTGESEFEALIDANYPLEVIPILPAEFADAATIHVSDSVSILAQTE